jgi:hypothetical protein
MKVTFFVITFFLLNASFAQTNTDSIRIKKSSIEFNFGVIHTRLIDQGYTDSKLLFYGTNSKFRIGFSRELSTHLFNFALEVADGKVRSLHGNLPSQLTQGVVTLEYFHRLQQFNLFERESDVFIGINGSSRIYFLENSPIIDNTSIFTMQGIHLIAATRIKLNQKQQLNVSYLVPALVSAGRVLYSEADYSYRMQAQPIAYLLDYSRTTYFSVFDLIQLKADYTKKFSSAASFTIRYSFIYAESRFKAPIALYSNEILFGLKFGI